MEGVDFDRLLPIYNVRVILMSWAVKITEPVQAFLDGLDDEDKREVVAAIKLLQAAGPQLTRPYADVLKTSRHHNMKELRASRGVSHFRILFAFDSRRQAILLVGGEKVGYQGGTEAFYKRFIKDADDLFDQHIAELKKESTAASKKGQPRGATGRKAQKSRKG